MSAACVCPDVEITHPIPTTPLTCACCGSPLRITCDGDCGEDHVRAAFKAIERPKPAHAPKAPTLPHECPRCHRAMPKAVGRPRKICDDCLTPAEKGKLERTRAWNEARLAATGAAT